MLRWYTWGVDLAVADPATGRAFALGPSAKGWREVNLADVSWEGKPISEAAAKSGWRDELGKFGGPPLTSLRG